MNVNLEEIVSIHEIVDFEKKYLFIPFPESDELIVLLSAHNQKEKYFLLKTFIANQKTNLLFMTDPKNTWYLDDDGGATYNNILKKMFSNFSKNKIHIFGSSMAGYAALHFAIINNVNCLVCNPQVDLALSIEFGWPDLKANMNKILATGKVVNIAKLLDRTLYTSCICVIHGHNPIDVANVELLLGSATAIRKLLVYTIDADDHDMPFGRDVQKIYQVIGLMKTVSDFNVNDDSQPGKFSTIKYNRKKLAEQGYTVPHRFLANRSERKFLEICASESWALRGQLQSPGFLIFPDVGYYTSKGKLSGAFCTFDGVQFSLIGLSLSEKIISFPTIEADKKIRLLRDNEVINENLWCRVPEKEILRIDDDGYFEAVYSDTKNCYINWNLSFLLPLGFKAGHFISCLIDVDLDDGILTLSLGAFGEEGYYQSNKIIKDSGKHCFTFQANSCIAHKDSLYCRLYFYPDSLSKRVKVKSFSVVHGYYPDPLFWS